MWCFCHSVRFPRIAPPSPPKKANVVCYISKKNYELGPLLANRELDLGQTAS